MSKPAKVIPLDQKRQNTLIEMERALLGALINFSGEGLSAQQEALKAIRPYTLADVYNPTNQSIFSSVTSMIAEGAICTAETLYHRLTTRGALDDIGGFGTIVGICKDSYSSGSIDSIRQLAGSLVEESRRRKAFELESIVRQGEADGRPLDDILADVQTRLDSLKKQKHEAPRLRLSAWGDISAPTPVSWLIKGVLETNSLSCLYGASGCGKSFIAVDLSLCVASGNYWYGHKVKQGSVVYFAGEGREGLRRRVASWLQNEEAETAEAVKSRFYLADHACLLPDDVDDVIETLTNVPDLRLVVLDTVNRTMIGDENSTRDMTAYVQACDKIKQAIPNLTILLIHHTGHSASDRARGSSALRASLDTEISASVSNGVITVTSTKSKDAEPFAPLFFKLETVELDGWQDEEGQAITSARLNQQTEGDAGTKEQKGAKVSGKNQQAAITILRALAKHCSNNLEAGGYDTAQARVLFDDWKTECVKQKLVPKACTFNERILLPLQKADLVTLEAPYVRLNQG